ncbi:MAG: TolC family protein [Bacteroidetes bacterium]|nr:MAG: TolC family protein [Bacteroidota bacterium]
MKAGVRQFLIFFCLSFPLVVFSQNPWTLQQCIDHALENNIQIRQTELSTELNKEYKSQSLANLFPSLNGSASQNYFYGRSIDPFTNSFTTSQVRSNSFSLGSSVSLFEGFQLQNSLRQSQLNYLSSQFDLQKVRNDISLNVVTYYLQVLYNKELLASTNQQLEATRIQRDKISRMFELGSVSKGNLLDMEAQLASDELRLVQAQSSYDQSLLSLTQLLELSLDNGFAILDPMLNTPSLPADQLNTNTIYAAALNTQPDIQSYELRVKSAEKGLSIARGGRYPRLVLSGSLSTNFSTSSQDIVGYDIQPPSTIFSGFTGSGDSVYTFVNNTKANFEQTPFRDQLDNNLGKSVGFSLQIPLFNGWSAKTNVARAKINLEQSKLNLDQTRKNLLKSVQQAVSDAYSAFKRHEAGQKSQQALTESFNFNQQRYDLGLISSYDYLLVKNNLAKAEADLLQAKYDFIFRLKILDFYQGKKLTF